MSNLQILLLCFVICATIVFCLVSVYNSRRRRQDKQIDIAIFNLAEVQEKCANLDKALKKLEERAKIELERRKDNRW